MQAFLNDPKIKANLVAQLEAHCAADEIIQGIYWQNGKGCAVGCCVHGNDHSLFPLCFGIPESIAHLMDGIFEGLLPSLAKKFPLELIKAIPIGADLSKVENLFLEWLLIDPAKGVARFNPGPSIPAVAALHRRAAEGGSVADEEWAAASDAARDASDAASAAARAAARAAASDAAWAAAWAAASDAAWAAAWAAARDAASDAAWDAAWAAQSQKLIELLAAAPVLMPAT